MRLAPCSGLLGMNFTFRSAGTEYDSTNHFTRVYYCIYSIVNFFFGMDCCKLSDDLTYYKSKESRLRAAA